MKRKEIIGLVLLVMFIMLPVIQAQTVTTINESILTQQNYSFQIESDAAGNILYMNLTVDSGVEIVVSVYRGLGTLPSEEVYIGGGSIGAFEENITLYEGLHTVYLYNPSLDTVMFVHGFWAINYEPEPITNTTTTTTTITNSTTWTGTGPPIYPSDYFDIFLVAMFAWVIPAMVALIILYIVWKYFREEHYDYLAIFGEDELLKKEIKKDEEGDET